MVACLCSKSVSNRCRNLSKLLHWQGWPDCAVSCIFTSQRNQIKLALLIISIHSKQKLFGDAWELSTFFYTLVTSFKYCKYYFKQLYIRKNIEERQEESSISYITEWVIADKSNSSPLKDYCLIYKKNIYST